MRLTLIHDHKFIIDGGKYYSTGKFSNDVLSRYFVEPVDKIQFIGRVEENSYDIHSLARTSGHNIEVNPINFLKRKKDFITKRKQIKEFLKMNISENDMVIIRMPSEISYVAADFLRDTNIPYGIELVGDPWDALWHHGSPIAKIMSFINKKKVKKYIKKSKNNIYVTKDYLQKKYPSNDKSFSASNVLIHKIENNYKNDKNQIKKIGMIGSLDTKYKGINTALKSLSTINSKFIFEIVGNGPQSKWKKKISDLGLSEKVILKGAVKSGKDINDWFSTLDMYIQPSYTEGLPRALIEAMSNGIPCLGSRVGGIPELLEEKYIHTAKDYKTLAKQITTVLNDSALRKQMSEKNLKVSQHYLSETIQRERERFIKSIYEEHYKNES